MNTPNYILQRNNQTVINLRPIHQRMGYTPAEFPSWFKDRIRKMNLTEGLDFVKYSENRHFQYVVPVKVALSILNTVPAAKAAPIKKEIAETLAADTPTEAENAPVPAPAPDALPIVPPEPAASVAVRLTGPIGVMQIEGRAAVHASDLYSLWNTPETRRVSGWLNYRIEKLGLVLGKHYVEYDIPPSPGHQRGAVGYIVSLDAAISIADAEKKGKGKALAAFLIGYRKELSKLRLSTKGSLSDFIGMEPVNVDPVESEPAYQTVTPVEATPAQSSIFDPTTQTVYSSADEEHAAANTQTATEANAAEPGTMWVQGLGFVPVITAPKESEPSPQAEDSRSTAENQPVTESPDWVDPEEEPQQTEENQGPNMFDLMVKFAQGLLQQAQGMSDLYRQMLTTSGTVSELVKIEQQAALRKLGLYPGKATIPAMTLRDKINHAVNKRHAITGEKHEDIFKAIYARLSNDYGYSVLDFERKKGQSHLQLCEELGIISIVWDIVNGAAFNRYATAKPKATA